MGGLLFLLVTSLTFNSILSFNYSIIHFKNLKPDSFAAII
ncbi:hypothetical protein B4098_0384 [Heyndrickxia coagulans]|uniref:Uncharacterized protein n=1 Tax=Heyndrickxia coagulans TaxID=1398 RepID=A0A150K089_HEYCO|nr:hypothetical protein B4098_0384 [Heyndrickxia coagulans]